MSHQNVTSKRATFTKAEREYVKGIVRNLSFQRLTDREIMNWLHDEKQIDLDRSTISKMRNQVEKNAENWYIGLRESGAKYLAFYKERLDSLLSYQKKLHEIINKHGEESPELVLRSICELHRIEISLHTLMKELPGDIKTTADEEPEKQKYLNFEDWRNRFESPRIDVDSSYSDEENGRYYWGLHKKYNEYVDSHKYGGLGPDCQARVDYISDPAWDDNPIPVIRPKSLVQLPDPLPEPNPQPQGQPQAQAQLATNIEGPVSSTETKQKNSREQLKKFLPDDGKKGIEQSDTIDIDILGREYKPFDVVQWIECSTCNKFLKDKDMLRKHFQKYHTFASKKRNEI